MEAFTDFQKPSSDKTSITTYLEGEIIDFKTHSLETFNFPSNIKDDAHNWRKLEPFCQLSNDQLVKSLVSRKFMKGLADNWVFMRWKGKILCPFQVTPIIVLIHALRFLFHYLPVPFQLGQLFFPHPPPQLRLFFRKYWTIIKGILFCRAYSSRVFSLRAEKCFITPQTSPDVGVLTIGGFYFLSLRRSDGQVQGFYYDPMSQPFQELNLKPRERLFPTYEFR